MAFRLASNRMLGSVARRTAAPIRSSLLSKTGISSVLTSNRDHGTYHHFLTRQEYLDSLHYVHFHGILGILSLKLAS
jgi:hypothetical protein